MWLNTYNNLANCHIIRQSLFDAFLIINKGHFCLQLMANRNQNHFVRFMVAGLLLFGNNQATEVRQQSSNAIYSMSQAEGLVEQQSLMQLDSQQEEVKTKLIATNNNIKPVLQAKSVPPVQTNLAQTDKKKKPKPPQSKMIQSKSNNGQGAKDLNSYLATKQARLLKGLDNPIAKKITELESKLTGENPMVKMEGVLNSFRKAKTNYKSLINEINSKKEDQSKLDNMIKTTGPQTKKQGGPTNKVNVQTAELKTENQQMLEQIDLDGMFKKFSNNTNPEKIKKAQELVDATTDAHKGCQKCGECPVCQAQTISPLEELASHSNEMTFMSADEKPEEVKFSILPQDLRDFVTKDVQVLNSERIIGYNTYNNILAQSHNLNSDNADYYNVTVNFIMKRSTSGKQITRKELPIQVYEKSVAEVDSQKQQKQTEVVEEDNEPRVIMPNDLGKVVTKEQTVQPEEQNQELVSLETQESGKQKVVQAVEQQVSQIPIELTNEQIATQLDNLTPDEAIQLAEEAGTPVQVTNLQLSSEINFNSSNNASAAMTQEEESIIQGFTEFQPTNEKTAMDNLFDQDFSKMSKAQLQQVKNVTKTISHQMSERDQQHIDFLTRVHQKAEQDIINKQKGLAPTITKNKKAQELYSSARIEKAEQDIIKQEKQALSQQSDPEIAHSTSANSNLDTDGIQTVVQQKQKQLTGQQRLHFLDKSDYRKLAALEDEKEGGAKDKDAKKAEAAADAPQPSIESLKKKGTLTDTEIFDAIMHMKPPGWRKKGKGQKGKPGKMNPDLKKMVFDETFKDFKIDLDFDKNAPISEETPRQKIKKFTKKQLEDPFNSGEFMPKKKKKNKGANKKEDQKELMDLRKAQKKIHDEIMKEITEIFEGKNQLTKKEIWAIKNPLREAVRHIHLNKPIEGKKRVHKGGKKNKKGAAATSISAPAASPSAAPAASAPASQAATSTPAAQAAIASAAPAAKSAIAKAQSRDGEVEEVQPEQKVKVKPSKKIRKKSKKASKKKVAKKKTVNIEMTDQDKQFSKAEVLKEIADSLGGVVGTENREMSTNLKDLDNEIAAINKEIAENKKALKRKKLIKKQFKIGRDEKMNLKKIMQGKRLITHNAQISKSSQVRDNEEGTQNAQITQTVNQTVQDITPNEILEMEEKTLRKKIEIDLKVLAKIEKEKNPEIQGDFHFQIIQVNDNGQILEEDEEEDQEEEVSQKKEDDQNTQESLSQQKDEEPSEDIEKQLQMASSAKNQSLTQVEEKKDQTVLHKMTELQKMFEETSKRSAEIQSQKEKAEVLEKQIKQQAEEEKRKRDDLMKKANEMAQADLAAKRELRKASEQAAIIKEQNVLNFQKQLDQEAKALADKKQALENTKQEAVKAKKMVEEAELAEKVIKERLQKEQQLRTEMEKKEQEKTQQAIKKTKEMQKQHELQMQKLMQQQLELQKKKTAILEEQESERRKLEEQLEMVNKMKGQLLQASGEPHQNLNQEQKQEVADNLNLLSKEQLVIQEAIDKVKKAEEDGERKGMENAKKLIEKTQQQSLEQSQADVAQLTKRFQTTSQQVQHIISNFNQVHSDLIGLRTEYIQQLEQEKNSTSHVAAETQEAVQLDAKIHTMEKSNLALKMHSKQREIKHIVASLNTLKESTDDQALVQLIDDTSKAGMKDLVQIDNSTH